MKTLAKVLIHVFTPAIILNTIHRLHNSTEKGKIIIRTTALCEFTLFASKVLVGRQLT